MTLLEKVKPRIGVFYSEINKDNEVQSIIDGALMYFEGAGWNIDPSSPSPLAVEALVLYCKMAHPTSAFQITNHPVLTSLIAQGRSEKDGDI